MIALLVALAGGLGASIRYGVDSRWSGRTRSTVPWATFGINVAGSFLLGLLYAQHPGEDAYRVLGVGLLGGFTTFGSVSVQTLELARTDRLRAAAYVLGTLAAGVAAAAAGLTLG